MRKYILYLVISFWIHISHFDFMVIGLFDIFVTSYVLNKIYDFENLRHGSGSQNVWSITYISIFAILSFFQDLIFGNMVFTSFTMYILWFLVVDVLNSAFHAIFHTKSDNPIQDNLVQILGLVFYLFIDSLLFADSSNLSDFFFNLMIYIIFYYINKLFITRKNEGITAYKR